MVKLLWPALPAGELTKTSQSPGIIRMATLIHFFLSMAGLQPTFLGTPTSGHSQSRSNATEELLQAAIRPSQQVRMPLCVIPQVAPPIKHLTHLAYKQLMEHWAAARYSVSEFTSKIYMQLANRRKLT